MLFSARLPHFHQIIGACARSIVWLLIIIVAITFCTTVLFGFWCCYFSNWKVYGMIPSSGSGTCTLSLEKAALQTQTLTNNETLGHLGTKLLKLLNYKIVQNTWLFIVSSIFIYWLAIESKRSARVWNGCSRWYSCNTIDAYINMHYICTSVHWVHSYLKPAVTERTRWLAEWTLRSVSIHLWKPEMCYFCNGLNIKWIIAIVFFFFLNSVQFSNTV